MRFCLAPSSSCCCATLDLPGISARGIWAPGTGSRTCYCPGAAAVPEPGPCASLPSTRPVPGYPGARSPSAPQPIGSYSTPVSRSRATPGPGTWQLLAGRLRNRKMFYGWLALGPHCATVPPRGARYLARPPSWPWPEVPPVPTSYQGNPKVWPSAQQREDDGCKASSSSTLIHHLLLFLPPLNLLIALRQPPAPSNAYLSASCLSLVAHIVVHRPFAPADSQMIQAPPQGTTCIRSSLLPPARAAAPNTRRRLWPLPPPCCSRPVHGTASPRLL
ncbi:hypothetical protein CDD83_610 [Cordyceps sp. RAO-2017]|nr:hypothetical protein CDD83_610 [Cordyceps sp. RAO-2017]